MALPGGVQITGFLSPTASGDTYATHDAFYGRDGLRNVDLLNDLNNIPEDRRRSGMIVGVSGGTEYYRLLPAGTGWTYTITDWTQAFFSPSEVISLISSGSSQNVLSFSASTNGQTLFNSILTPPSNSPQNSDFYINGVRQTYGISEDYIITGSTSLVWISSKHIIETDDDLIIVYL